LPILALVVLLLTAGFVASMPGPRGDLTDCLPHSPDPFLRASGRDSAIATAAELLADGRQIYGATRRAASHAQNIWFSLSERAGVESTRRLTSAYVKGAGAEVRELFLIYNVSDALSLSPCLAASLVPDVNADSLTVAESKLGRLLHTLQVSQPR